MGGCMIKPISCNKGFRSFPSEGVISKERSKGLEVKIMNAKKPTLIIAKTDRTRVFIANGIELLATATASVQEARINTHKSKEPS